MVTTINYSTSAHSTNVNLTKCKTWGLTTKLKVTYSRWCLRHTFGHTDLVTASRIFTQTPAVVHKFTCFLLPLHPPFWHSPGSPELSYVLRYCPFTLPVRWQHSTGFTNPVSCIVLEKEWQKRRRGGNQIRSRLRQSVWFSSDPLRDIAQTIRMHAQTCHICLVKATFIQAPHNFAATFLTFF